MACVLSLWEQLKVHLHVRFHSSYLHFNASLGKKLFQYWLVIQPTVKVHHSNKTWKCHRISNPCGWKSDSEIDHVNKPWYVSEREMRIWRRQYTQIIFFTNLKKKTVAVWLNCIGHITKYDHTHVTLNFKCLMNKLVVLQLKPKLGLVWQIQIWCKGAYFFKTCIFFFKSWDLYH